MKWRTISEKTPDKDGFCMKWEVELYRHNWVQKYRDGDIMHLKSYSELSNCRNVFWLDESDVSDREMEGFGKWLIENNWQRTYVGHWYVSTWTKEEYVDNAHQTLPELFKLFRQSKSNPQP